MPKKKWCVVYKGRNPGVYDNWAAAHAQVDGFVGNAHMSFDSKWKAMQSWSDFWKNLEAGAAQNAFGASFCHDSHGEASSSNVGSGAYNMASGANNVNPGSYACTVVGGVVPEVRPEKVLLRFSMVDWLTQACNALEIPHATYRMVDRAVVGSQVFHRCQGSLRTAAFKEYVQKPIVCLGRFAPTEDLAREDVALMILREVVGITGMHIHDFNFHNMGMIEEQINVMCSENLDVVNENQQLRVDIANLSRKA